MASQAVPKLVKEGRQRHRAGDIAGALDCYKRFLRKKPQQVDVLLLAAMAAAQINETQLAEQLARRAVRYRPDAKSFITLGRVLVQQESWDEAVGVLQKAVMDQQVGIDARFQLGQALARLGRTAEAGKQFTELLGDAPEHAPAWSELGLLQMGQDRPDEAVVSFGASLRHRPDDAGTLANLGAAYLVTGRPAEAEESVVAALSAEPGQPDALRTLGLLCKDQGRLSEATEAFEKLIQQSAADASAWSGLAAVLQAKGEMEASEKAYEKSLTIDPGHVAALAGRAEWLEWQGRYQDGLASLDDGVAELSGPGVAVVRARLLRRLDRAEEGRTLLKSVLETTTGNVELRKQILFSLGDACDATKRYDEAFDYYAEGNRLSAAAYDRDAHSHMLARQNSLASGPGSGVTGEQMIFVLGMPRSGTTLVEQILSAHPDVYAAGELSILGRLGVSAMDGQGEISAERAIEMGQSYLSELPAGARSAFRTTDKMPLNFLYLGLMQAALPGARVIHCRRDPRDVALSCYFIDFIDPTLGFSARLEWLGDYINSYLEQMDKWRETLALPMLEVDYEALVDDPEHWSRRLVDFAGLEWNPACLSFHDQNRVAATASHAQVRKPVYRSSVGRWRHYESHLAPLLQAMERKE